ncbi:hypothetical protein BCR44DRAFT_1429572 [Catenaria anguillulae PL171]|uniref:Uncharacterized protein n=1 Tax=Catenaria anguillulae PL171 TaxID=765915 RepID=A0A1Y2HY95_9FUNG|nr:hypothetical protein BCR44DRAFT_1429572 [Catenaria anguillulae PL171]
MALPQRQGSNVDTYIPGRDRDMDRGRDIRDRDRDRDRMDDRYMPNSGSPPPPALRGRSDFRDRDRDRDVFVPSDDARWTRGPPAGRSPPPPSLRGPHSPAPMRGFDDRYIPGDPPNGHVRHPPSMHAEDRYVPGTTDTYIPGGGAPSGHVHARRNTGGAVARAGLPPLPLRAPRGDGRGRGASWSPRRSRSPVGRSRSMSRSSMTRSRSRSRSKSPTTSRTRSRSRSMSVGSSRSVGSRSVSPSRDIGFSGGGGGSSYWPGGGVGGDEYGGSSGRPLRRRRGGRKHRDSISVSIRGDLRRDRDVSPGYNSYRPGEEGAPSAASSSNQPLQQPARVPSLALPARPSTGPIDGTVVDEYNARSDRYRGRRTRGSRSRSRSRSPMNRSSYQQTHLRSPTSGSKIRSPRWAGNAESSASQHQQQSASSSQTPLPPQPPQTLHLRNQRPRLARARADVQATRMAWVRARQAAQPVMQRVWSLQVERIKVAALVGLYSSMDGDG